MGDDYHRLTEEEQQRVLAKKRKSDAARAEHQSKLDKENGIAALRRKVEYLEKWTKDMKDLARSSIQESVREVKESLEGLDDVHLRLKWGYAELSNANSHVYKKEEVGDMTVDPYEPGDSNSSTLNETIRAINHSSFIMQTTLIRFPSFSGYLVQMEASTIILVTKYACE